MTPEVVCVSPKQSADTCMGLMTQKKIRHLPVVEDDRQVGLVSIDDHKFAVNELQHDVTGEL